MKFHIPQNAQFFLNVLLFGVYFVILKWIVFFILGLFLTLYLGPDVRGLQHELGFILHVSSTIIGLSLAIVITLTHTDHFYITSLKNGRLKK